MRTPIRCVIQIDLYAITESFKTAYDFYVIFFFWFKWND